jgi:hypothetical protein
VFELLLTPRRPAIGVPYDHGRSTGDVLLSSVGHFEGRARIGVSRVRDVHDDLFTRFYAAFGPEAEASLV